MANFTKKLTGNDFSKTPKIGISKGGKLSVSGGIGKGAGAISGLLPGPLKLIGKLLSATNQVASKLVDFAKKPLEMAKQASVGDKKAGGVSKGGGGKGLHLSDNSALQHALSGLNSVDKESAIDSGISVEESVKMHH